MKKIISITVDIDTWIQAKSKVPNISAYLNECLNSLNGRTATELNIETLKVELGECQKIITEANIRQSVINQSIKELDAEKSRKQLEIKELEQFQRWNCGACHHLNFMDRIRCENCHLPTKTDSKTTLVNIKGD